MTGGLQEQVTDGKEWFGFGIEPSSKSIIGSQEVPYIYEDRINGQEFSSTLETFYNLSQSERDKMGELGRKHVLKNYNLQQYHDSWEKIFDKVVKEHGSWNDRKNYKGWELTEL